jgi:hypothetical protein
LSPLNFNCSALFNVVNTKGSLQKIKYLFAVPSSKLGEL